MKTKFKKEKRFNARFLAVGPEVAVIKELIWQEYLQLVLVEEKKYGNVPRRGETNGFLWSAGKISMHRQHFQSRLLCGKHFISGKVAKLWDHHDPDWVPTQNLGHQKIATLQDERARGHELKRVPGDWTWKTPSGWIKVQKTKTWWTWRKGYRQFLRYRISSAHQAQQ